MTREMAVLGIPTVSVYQGDLLEVDRYLIAQDALIYRPDIRADEIMTIFNQGTVRPAQTTLLAKGKEAYDMILVQIQNYER